jgi:protein required for attachment to host cells
LAKQVVKPRRTARLPQAPKMELRHKRTLIVVADGSRARFLEPSEDSRKLVPSEQSEMTAAEARRPARDLVTDKPSRGFASARSGERRHAFEPSHDLHKMQKHNFTARLAEVLDKACEEKQFDRLVLVAPERSLGELRSSFRSRKKVVSHEVAKDLTNSTPTALRKVLADCLSSAALA